MEQSFGLTFLYAVGILIWLGFLFVVGIVAWKSEKPPGSIRASESSSLGQP